jgi:hypothetical protein
MVGTMPAPNVGSESLPFADEVDPDDARYTAPANAVLRAVAKINAPGAAARERCCLRIHGWSRWVSSCGTESFREALKHPRSARKRRGLFVQRVRICLPANDCNLGTRHVRRRRSDNASAAG